MNSASNHSFSILHIILSLRPTNGQYNEHCLPMIGKRDITICTYFKSEITPPGGITLYDGDNSLTGFFCALREALTQRQYDIIHVHTPHASVLLPMTLSLCGLFWKLRPSTVHTIQNSFESFQLRHKLMFIPGFAFFRKLVFCSNASYQSFPAFFKWLGRDRMHVVQNAVDLSRLDRSSKAVDGRKNGHFTIVTVGLIQIKNPLTMLEAFRQSHNQVSKLVVLGQGNQKPLVDATAKESGLQERVEMTGLISRDKVFEHYTAADLFVSASRGEGLPVAVLEAMACHCPVILSDIPPHREIADGIDFIPLIEPDDAEGFARQIERIREMSNSDRAELGQKCRDLVEERFSLHVMHQGYQKIYGQITDNQLLPPFHEAG